MRKLIKIKRTPLNKQIILGTDTLSLGPANPMPVVTMKIRGPMNASEVFTINAFSKLFNLNIINAARISILLEKIRNKTI